MLVATSLVIALFASKARAQAPAPYDYTYYTNGNNYVCAIRAPFGQCMCYVTPGFNLHLPRPLSLL